MQPIYLLLQLGHFFVVLHLHFRHFALDQFLLVEELRLHGSDFTRLRQQFVVLGRNRALHGSDLFFQLRDFGNMIRVAVSVAFLVFS